MMRKTGLRIKCMRMRNYDEALTNDLDLQRSAHVRGHREGGRVKYNLNSIALSCNYS